MSLDTYRRGRLRPDWLLALLAVGLAAFGLIMILSASQYLAGTTGNVYGFVTKQSLSLGIGLVAMLVLSQIDYRLWRGLAGPIIVVTTLLLLGVFISPECRGVHRCLDVGPIHFQPAEFVKLGFIIYLAAWLAKVGPKIRDLQEGVLPFVLLVGFVGGLVILEPDMGTTMTLIFASVLLFVVAGARMRHIGTAMTIGFFLAFLMIIIAPYRMARLQTFLNPADDPLGAGYQTTQIGIAVGSGGLWGLGFGEGKLKYLGYVPEVHTDSIFAVVVEELGFIRAAIVLLVMLWLFLRGFRIARDAPDSFGRLLGVGMVGLIAIQAFINLAAMLQLLPLTGIPLPFISYGGSSLVASFIAVGILLSISRYRDTAKA